MGERRTIGLREIRALKPGGAIWDAALPGFGARRQKDAVSFILKYRTREGRQRFHTIGRHGAPWTPDMARREARRLLGEVVAGGDPAAAKQEQRKAVTVAELCRQYLADAEAGRLLVRGGKPKKPLTLASDRGRIEGHIIPLLGGMKVGSVTHKDVDAFMHRVADGASAAKPTKTKPRGVSRLRGGRGVATRTIGLLGAIFNYAVDHGMRAENPAHRIRKFAESRRERRLSDDEYQRLAAGLVEAERHGVWVPAVACARFLALTGWRSGEALALRWQDVDALRRVATLADTKTGRSIRPLSHAALDCLRAAPRIGGEAALVFPPSKPAATMAGFKRFFRGIVARGGLPADVTPHVLRHSFVSLAADLGLSEPTIAALVGHKGRSITARYTHLADAPLLAAADVAANETLRRMGETRTADVVKLRATASAGG